MTHRISMAVDGPGAIDPHPEGPEQSGGRPEAAFLFREEWRRSRQGKKVAEAVAGIRARRRPSAPPAFGQICQIEDVMAVI